MKASYFLQRLNFIKPARTSRGEMLHHDAWIIKLEHHKRIGFGEASPLQGLSTDDTPGFEDKLKECCRLINDGFPVSGLVLDGFPSLRFAFESATAGLLFDQPFKYANNSFISGEPIAINGLIWMDSRDSMEKQAFEKAEAGFTCLKFKIGALDFDEECRMLEAVRKRMSAFWVEIRLDANGAFSADDVFDKLKELKRFEVHSIEQPIKQGQVNLMQEVVAKSPVDIALDEELIGIENLLEKEMLIKTIKPEYIILKPTLLGGTQLADEWIEIAGKHGAGWWATSALESNIGLNIIAQWVSQKRVLVPQGLGTGSLYQNNFKSPIRVHSGYLVYDSSLIWNIPMV